MQPNYIIVGLGIAGTLLSYELWKQGKSVLVIDDPVTTPKASMVAGAVINPVNIGKWMPIKNHEIFIATALETYKEVGDFLRTSFIEDLSMLVFHENENDKELFIEKQPTSASYIHKISGTEISLTKRLFNFTYGAARVQPVWRINAEKLLFTWRNFLKEKKALYEEHFEMEDCRITAENITYKNIVAEKIIFCEGAAAMRNPLFSNLPFTKNRGEALLLSIPDLPAAYIYQHKIRLVPTSGGLFWCGSNYQWNFDHLQPDELWRHRTESLLRQWLNIPFTVLNHIVAERPTTAGQYLLAGMHPAMPSIAVFNGLGTKGFSAGPLVAKELYKKLNSHEYTIPETIAKPLTHWLR